MPYSRRKDFQTKSSVELVNFLKDYRNLSDKAEIDAVTFKPDQYKAKDIAVKLGLVGCKNEFDAQSAKWRLIANGRINRSTPTAAAFLSERLFKKFWTLFKSYYPSPRAVKNAFIFALMALPRCRLGELYATARYDSGLDYAPRKPTPFLAANYDDTSGRKLEQLHTVNPPIRLPPTDGPHAVTDLLTAFCASSPEVSRHVGQEVFQSQLDLDLKPTRMERLENHGGADSPVDFKDEMRQQFALLGAELSSMQETIAGHFARSTAAQLPQVKVDPQGRRPSMRPAVKPLARHGTRQRPISIVDSDSDSSSPPPKGRATTCPPLYRTKPPSPILVESTSAPSETLSLDKSDNSAHRSHRPAAKLQDPVIPFGQATQSVTTMQRQQSISERSISDRARSNPINVFFGEFEHLFTANQFQFWVAVELSDGQFVDANHRKTISTFLQSHPTAKDLQMNPDNDIHHLVKSRYDMTKIARRLKPLVEALKSNPPCRGRRMPLNDFQYPPPLPCRYIGAPNERHYPPCGGKYETISLEIAGLPYLTPHKVDIWRIFCADVFRGLADDHVGGGAARSFQPEWQRVVPLHPTLRAYVRWLWLEIEGRDWDHWTNTTTAASQESLKFRDNVRSLVTSERKLSMLVSSEKKHTDELKWNCDGEMIRKDTQMASRRRARNQQIRNDTEHSSLARREVIIPVQGRGRPIGSAYARPEHQSAEEAVPSVESAVEHGLSNSAIAPIRITSTKFASPVRPNSLDCEPLQGLSRAVETPTGASGRKRRRMSQSGHWEECGNGLKPSRVNSPFYTSNSPDLGARKSPARPAASGFTSINRGTSHFMDSPLRVKGRHLPRQPTRELSGSNRKPRFGRIEWR